MNFFNYIIELFRVFFPVNYQKTALEIGSQRLTISLNSIDRRRLRGQHREFFRAILWYASNRDEILVYASGDSSASTKPIGVIPRRYTSTIFPFMDRNDEFVSYTAEFDKDSEALTIDLHVTTVELEQQKKEESEKESIEIEESLQQKHREKMQRPYCLKSDINQSVNAGILTPTLKGKRKLEGLSIEFYDKSKYLDRHFRESKLFLNDEYIRDVSLDNRIIRTYYSGHTPIIKSCNISRDSFSMVYLSLLIGIEASS